MCSELGAAEGEEMANAQLMMSIENSANGSRLMHESFYSRGSPVNPRAVT
jgi:hypothetical protein